MPSYSEDRSLEKALNGFIDDNIDEKFLVDLENPSCRLISPSSGRDSPTSDKSTKTIGLLNNLRSALKDGSEFAKTVIRESGSKSISSRSSIDRNGSTNKKEILEHAEAVIEYQRERIKILEKTLQKYNIAITKTAELHKDELDQYEKQNKDMRLQMQTVISDYDAISKRYQADMESFEALKGKSIQADSEIMKKDKKIKELEKKLELLPKENELLKMQKDDLQQEVKALKNELFPPMRSWERSFDRAPTDHVKAFMYEQTEHNKTKVNSRYSPNDVNKPHVLCDVRKQETAAMGKCLMQVENDLASYKRLYEDQRSEIQRLNNMLESKNKKEKFENNQYYGSHKQLMYLRDVFVSMVKASDKMSETLKVKAEEPVNQEDRSLHAAYVLKSNSEQREMYDKLLDVVRNMISVKSSMSSFYRCKVDYCKLVELNEFDLNLKFHKMLVEVDDSKVLVHQLEDDQIVHTEIIVQQNLKGVRTDYKNLQFILKDDHYHVFKFDNSDTYNRLYYALQYAGFLVDDGKLSIYSKIDLAYLNAEENWPPDLVPVLFSKVVSSTNAPRSPMNIPNAYNYQYNMGMAAAGLGNMVPPYQSMDVQMNNLFENVNVMSEFTTSLLYYDPNSNLLVVYGPNLANKPRVLNPANTYKFKILNSLEYSSMGAQQRATEATNSDGDVGNENGNEEERETYIDSYQVPFATFPNGEPVMECFNPQLTNYSLVSVKNFINDMNQLKTDFNQMSVNGGQLPINANYNQSNMNGSQSPPPYNSPMNNMGAGNNHSNQGNMTSPSSHNNQLNVCWTEYEFEVYYVLPLSPRYNQQLTILMEKMNFLRLKSGHIAAPEEPLGEIKEDDKFYRFSDGMLELTFNGVGLVKLSCSNSYYMKNDYIYMVTVMPGKDSKDNNSYSFKIGDPLLYRQFINDAERNGMKYIKNNVMRGTNQVCIVTKGYIKVFTRGPNGELEPYLVFHPENTEIFVDDDKKTIKMAHNELDFALNIDCLEPKNYANWILALKVAGFIEASEAELESGDSLKLDEFRFEIALFNDEDLDDKRSVRITGDKICLYTKPSAHKPIFTWDKASLNLEAYGAASRLRIFLKRHTKQEERFDLTFPRQDQFDNVMGLLHKLNYKIDQPFNKGGLRYHYIVSRPDKIALFKTKYEKSPLMVIEKKHYYEAKCSSDQMFVKFMTNDKAKDPIKLRFKKRETYNKFVTALKISNFLHFVEGLVPPKYVPEIIYGFACPEAKKVFKDCRS